VELLDYLTETAIATTAQVREQTALSPVEVVKGDFLEVEWWKDADVAYIANAVFGEELMQ
jgi:hypothetical protein